MIRSDVLQLLETKTQAINKFEKEVRRSVGLVGLAFQNADF
jgi:hypothetical protein